MNFGIVYLTKRSTLGHLQLDVLMKETLELPSEVTKYPVEDGTPDITDHITQQNETLEISASISATELLSFEFGTCTAKLIDAIQQLRDMHKARQPITVVTGLGSYDNMAFTKMSVTRSSGGDSGGSWIDISASLMQIRKVALQTTTLPAEKASGDATSGTGTAGQAGQTQSRTGTTTPASNNPSNGNTDSWARQLTGSTATNPGGDWGVGRLQSWGSSLFGGGK
jgi:hypothetical protein